MEDFNIIEFSEVVVEKVSSRLSLPEFSQVYNLVDVEQRNIYLEDEISLDTPYFIKSRAELIYKVSKDNTSPINLYITSYGGDAHGFFGSVDVIRSLPTKVNTFAFGAAMSAGAFLLFGGTGERVVGKNTTVMVHSIIGGTSGDLLKINVDTKYTNDLQKRIYSYLEEVSDKKTAFWKSALKKDNYLNLQDCLSYKIIDRIL